MGQGRQSHGGRNPESHGLRPQQVPGRPEEHYLGVSATVSCILSRTSRSWLVAAVLTAATLRDADLSGANLDIALFDGADLSRANLSGASIFGVLFTNAKLVEANLSDARRVIANFTNANLTRANLVNADMAADMRNQPMGLMRVFFTSADLTGANL